MREAKSSLPSGLSVFLCVLNPADRLSRCVAACTQTTNEIWIIWKNINSTHCSSQASRSNVLCIAAIFCLAVFFFLFLSRPKKGSAEERKGAGEAPVAAFRPDVAYNLLHTLFYGLLAFSTMRWVHTHTHTHLIAGRRSLDSSTQSQVVILISFPSREHFKSTFPLDCLMFVYSWAVAETQVLKFRSLSGPL